MDQINPDGKLRQRLSDKIQRGVSGNLHPVAAVTLRYELDQEDAFEHPTLVADLDFTVFELHRLNFMLKSKANASHRKLILGNLVFCSLHRS